MKIGKLPEPMLIRSVLKEVEHRREEVLVGPAVGQDCAVVELTEGEVFVLSSDPITGTTKDIGRHSVHVTANDLAASGADPLGIMLTILLTPDTQEGELKEMMRGVESACRELNMEVMGGHTEITQVVKQPLISLTGVGKMKKENILTTASVKPGQDILITKWIGLEGTSVAAKEKEEELIIVELQSSVERDRQHRSSNSEQDLSVNREELRLNAENGRLASVIQELTEQKGQLENEKSTLEEEKNTLKNQCLPLPNPFG